MDLLEAFAAATKRVQRPMTLEIVGDGDELPRLRERAADLGLSDQVSLPGRIPRGPELFARVDRAHLFVLPSLSEGMPRSLIEAMARGTPALGSNIGGIPELLPPENLFPAGNISALTEKIVAIAQNPGQLAQMSQCSFDRSRQHWPDAIDRAKKLFWERIKQYAT